MHGLEPCDIKEVLLQTAIYAGVPTANTGFNIAREEVGKQEAMVQAAHLAKSPSNMI
jgi:alkylhydroperoxidase/carboxymuconolactone decarboxylase family protein YurZ